MQQEAALVEGSGSGHLEAQPSQTRPTTLPYKDLPYLDAMSENSKAKGLRSSVELHAPEAVASFYLKLCQTSQNASQL